MPREFYNYRFFGAVLGLILGGVTTFFLVAVVTDDDPLVEAFSLIFLCPVGAVIGAILGIKLALRLLRSVSENQEISEARLKSVRLVWVSALAVPILVTLMLWGIQRSRDLPSDQQLLSNFGRHRSTFDALTQMMQKDNGLTLVDYARTIPRNPQTVGVSAERIREYRRLLDEADMHNGLGKTGTGLEIDFYYWMQQGGVLSSDTYKGYAYLAVPPKQILSSLDLCQPNDEKVVEAYRHIDGRWYLYYRYVPG